MAQMLRIEHTRMPVLRLLGGQLGVVALSGVLLTLLFWGGDAKESASPAVGMLLVAIGCLAGAGVYRLIGLRASMTFASIVVGLSSARLLLTAGLGVAVFMSREPAKWPFWSALLLASIGTLVVEAAFGIASLRTPASRGPIVTPPAEPASGSLEAASR
ncbi:MAG: hypothetical protein RBS39_00025 [Phycisphaerales bacterium]|jgi:hypothetical protein|nr:hypothetical protein [Phycisphaerales bacterium]